MQSSSHLLSSSAPEFVWLFFTVSISLVKYSFSSLILFMSSVNCLAEFSYISLSVFIIAILNSLLFKSQLSMTLIWFPETFHFLSKLTFYLDCSCYRMDCFSVCAFEVALSCLDTILFSTIQQVGYFLLFSNRWCFRASFSFLLPALLALLDCGGAVSLQLRKIPCIHWDGGCPLCDQLTLAVGYHHCDGGM